MIAKIFYLTSPAPNRYVMNYQPFGSDELVRVEISEAHLANLIVDGAHYALRKSRVPETKPTESANERTDRRTQ